MKTSTSTLYSIDLSQFKELKHVEVRLTSALDVYIEGEGFTGAELRKIKRPGTLKRPHPEFTSRRHVKPLPMTGDLSSTAEWNSPSPLRIVRRSETSTQHHVSGQATQAEPGYEAQMQHDEIVDWPTTDDDEEVVAEERKVPIKPLRSLSELQNDIENSVENVGVYESELLEHTQLEI